MFVTTRQTLPTLRIRPTMLSASKLHFKFQKVTIKISVSLLMTLADDLLRCLKQNETFNCIYLFVLVDSHIFFLVFFMLILYIQKKHCKLQNNSFPFMY